jgi:hypothetical protein
MISLSFAAMFQFQYRSSLPAPRAPFACRSACGDVHDRLRESLRRLLGQIMSNPAFDGSVLVFAGCSA